MSVSLRPVTGGVLEVGADGTPTLLGGRCSSCDRHHFPAATACPWCRSLEVTTVPLSRTATAWGWTTVHTAPPGYDGPVPYGLGVVELPEGLRLVTRLVGDDPATIAFGDPMVLLTAPCGSVDGVEVVTWAFAPARADGGTTP